MSEHVEFLRAVADRANAAEFPPTAAGLRRAADELERLRHIVAVLRNSIGMTALTAQTIEDHVRVKGGRIEVWCLGEWLDVENEQARAADAAES